MLIDREWWTGWRDLIVLWYQNIAEFIATHRLGRKNSMISHHSANSTAMSAMSGGNLNDELKGVQLHPVALVDDFNPKASKAGV